MEKKDTLGSIVVERNAREERGSERWLGGGPRPRPDKLRSLHLSLDRNRAQIILQKNELYPLLPAYLSISANDNPLRGRTFHGVHFHF